MLLINFLHNFTFLIFFGLAVYIFIKNKKALMNQMVFGLLLFFSVWSLSLYFIQNPLTDKEIAIIFINIGSLASIGYGIFTFLSICVFTKLCRVNKTIYILLAAYFTSALILQLTTDFVSTSAKDCFSLWVIEYNNKYLYLLYSILHNILIFSSFIILIKFVIGKIDLIQKKQSLIILITGLISFTLASVNLFLPKLFPKVHIPFLVDLWMMIFAGGLVYSIVKYELFEITPKRVVNQIIDILPLGLVILDVNDQIIRFNKSILEITQRGKHDFENKDIKDIIQSLTRKKNNLNENLNSIEQVDIVLTNGVLKTVLIFFKKITDHYERPIGAILLIQDIEPLISAQKKLEELNLSLERKIEKRTAELSLSKEKAEESDRLKTAFLNNISHEIRTPLNAISGFSGMLDNPSLSEEKRKRFVSIIQNSSQRLISIVTDVITMSSLETKQEKVKIQKVNLNQILEDLFVDFQQKAQSQNLSLYTKQELNDKQSVVLTDKDKLIKILTNLLSNALKFTHVGFVEFGYSIKHNKVEFYVKDSGIGINPQFHDKIFKPFGQAEIPKDMLYGGTGIGLSIAKGYVELLGGKIWMQTNQEDGSVFYFTIPYTTAHDKDIISKPKKAE